MRLLFGLTVTLILIGTSNKAMAQRGGRGSSAAPGSPAYNFTSSPEWRQAGGNYGLYLQIMEQKAMMAQQKAMQAEYKEYQKQLQAAQKQQAAYEKWIKDQQAKKEKGKPVDPAYQQMLDEEARYKAAVEARAARIAAKKTKKKPAAKPKTESPPAEKTDDTKK